MKMKTERTETDENGLPPDCGCFRFHRGWCPGRESELFERQTYVLALIPEEMANALDVCPRAACGHRGSDHGVLATGCMVDDCPCGESPALDTKVRTAAAENFADTMSDEERIKRGFAAREETS